jgi:hypothetical protein
MYVGCGKSGRYYCQGAVVNHGTERCISFGGLRADQAVAAEILRVLKNGWALMRSCSLSSAA